MTAPLATLPERGHGWDVLAIGQSSLDQVALVDGLPPFAGKAQIRAWFERPGGQIATAVLAVQRLGYDGALVTPVGDDQASKRVLEPLREAGLTVRPLVRTGSRTQGAMILVDRASGERTVLWFRDPQLAVTPEDLSVREIERARVLLVDAADPEAAHWAAGVAQDAGIPVVLDADAVVDGVAALLERVDFPIVAPGFAEEFFGTRSRRDALDGLAGMGARFPVITLGEQGAIGGSGDDVIESPGFRVAVRDTTGAGDAFHGAFVFGLLEGLGATGILRIANAAAAMNCRALGAQAGLPDRNELDTFLREHGRRESGASDARHGDSDGRSN